MTLTGPVEAALFRVQEHISLVKFVEAYQKGHRTRPQDFPIALTVHEWRTAHIGWQVMQDTPPGTTEEVGLPESLRPYCDLDLKRGFYVLVGTVVQLLTLGVDGLAATEFVTRAHDMDEDVGHLYMLALDYIISTSALHEIAEETTHG
jgi:hypothetical protein